MLLKKVFFMGLVALTAASPLLEDRGSKGANTVGSKTGTKGKGGADTCPISAGVTCPRVKFTAAQISKAVKQAKAMKVKGKKGKGLHFPAKYKPGKETEVKGVKGGKAGGAKGGKTAKRDLEGKAIQARGRRGGRARTRPSTKARPKKTKAKKSKSKTKQRTTKGKNTKGKKGKPAKDEKCKVGKGVWMFPILEKGVWKPGVFPEVNYIILDSKYNYVKTAEREPGSAEEFEVCAEAAQRGKKGSKPKTKGTKG